MEYTLDSIRADFHDYWKTARNSVSYKINGRYCVPESISNFDIQLSRGDFGDGFNFQCEALNLRVNMNGEEKPYSAEFFIKVVPEISENGILCEKIIAIKDNCIYLKTK